MIMTISCWTATGSREPNRRFGNGSLGGKARIDLAIDLYVRGGASPTKLSGPLADAITSGKINLRFVP